jgi:FAD/FMN-containing dehydrogenase
MQTTFTLAQLADPQAYASEKIPHTLNQRVKEGFDPKGVLNPGRMWAGV